MGEEQVPGLRQKCGESERSQVQLWSRRLTNEGGRKRRVSQEGLGAGCPVDEETGPSPCLWDYAGERKQLTWDAKNLVR